MQRSLNFVLSTGERLIDPSQGLAGPPATPAFFLLSPPLYLKHTKPIPTPGPLHFLGPLQDLSMDDAFS